MNRMNDLKILNTTKYNDYFLLSLFLILGSFSYWGMISIASISAKVRFETEFSNFIQLGTFIGFCILGFVYGLLIFSSFLFLLKKTIKNNVLALFLSVLSLKLFEIIVLSPIFSNFM